MIMLDNTVVNVALPSIQSDLDASLSALEWTDQRLHARLRRAARHRRAAGRHLRPPPRLPVRRGPVRALLRDGRPRAERPVAGRQPRGPGHRRRAHDAGDAVDHHQRLPGARARQGDRHVGRRLGARARDRARWSAASSPSRSAGARSSSSTCRSPRWPCSSTLVADQGVARPERAAHRRLRRRRRRSPIGIGALVLALVEGNGWGWGSPRILGLLAASVAGLVVVRRSSSGARDSRWSSSRSSAAARSWARTAIAFVVSFAMLAMFFFMALYMQNILGYSPLEAGHPLPAHRRS